MRILPISGMRFTGDGSTEKNTAPALPRWRRCAWRRGTLPAVFLRGFEATPQPTTISAILQETAESSFRSSAPNPSVPHEPDSTGHGMFSADEVIIASVFFIAMLIYLNYRPSGSFMPSLFMKWGDTSET
jgi:hypothetical protein